MHKITLNAFDKTYEIIGFKHSMFREYALNGNCFPKSGLVGGFFEVEFASDADVSFLEKMVMIEWGERNFKTLSDDDYLRMNCFSGKLSCLFDEAESGKVYQWEHAIVTYYEEITHSFTGKPMKTRVVFSPFDLRVNNLLISRYSGKTEKGTWFFYEPEEEKQPKPAPKPTILVTKLKSDKKEALPNEKVTYQVTEFNQKQVSESDKKRIHWQVKVDGKKAEEFLRHGEKLELTIKEQWAGKEIIVMAYFVEPDEEKVREKTRVKEKLIEVTTKDGKYLFSLRPNDKHKAQTIIARELYKRGIQWFCPFADNYLELVDKSPELSTNSELKQFTWNEIVQFAEEDRWSLSYRSGKSGDWKTQKEGANGRSSRRRGTNRSAA